MKILTTIDLLALPGLGDIPAGHVGFGAKSDGLYQKIGTVETKLSVDGHTHNYLYDAVGKNVDTNTLLIDHQLKFDKNINYAASTNLFPTISNANGILSISTHVGLYGHQLGFSSNGSIYHKYFTAGSMTGNWARVWNERNLTSLSQLTDNIGVATHITDNTRHITSAERTAWNAKSNLALGTTSTTAFRGDYGNTAYNHSITTGNPHGTTFAQIDSKPTTLSGYGITDAYTKTEVNSLAKYIAGYSYINGFLVKTDIARTNNSMLVLHINGNSYGGRVPINTLVQVYNYVTSDAIIQVGALNNGYEISEVKAFYYNDLVYFWVPQQTSFMTMTFRLLRGEEQENKVVSVTNAAVPTTGVEKLVTIIPRTAWFKETLTSLSQLSNDSGFITSSASITGNADTATTATNLSRSVLAGNGLTGGGALSANVTLTLGTPDTLTAISTNAVTTTSHTHAITTTSVGAVNTIVQTNANGAIGTSRYGSYGVYNPAQTQGIWSIGSAYMMNATTTGLGTLYGLGYSYISVGGSSAASQHQIHFASSGTANATINLTTGDFRTVGKFIKIGGTSSQILMADGSVWTKPTTLSGYGITDAAPISHSNISGESTIHHTHTNKAIINQITQSNLDVLAKLSIVNGALQISTDAYSTGELTAYGAGTSTTVLTGISTTGAGNAITSIEKIGSELLATKGITFALESRFQVVTVLPASPDPNTYYFIKE